MLANRVSESHQNLDYVPTPQPLLRSCLFLELDCQDSVQKTRCNLYYLCQFYDSRTLCYFYNGNTPLGS